MGHHTSRIREQQAKARRKASFTLATLRHSDLIKIIEHRLRPGKKIPDGLDSDDAETMIRCVAYHLQSRFGDEPTELWEKLTNWCLVYCENWSRGWPDKGDMLIRVLEAIRGRRRDLSATECGVALRLTWDERCALGIKTIRPWNMTPAQLKIAAADRKRDMNRAREEAKRRRRGAVLRKDYEATSKTQTKPWTALGMSRSAYYAAGLHRTGPCLIERSSNDGHRPVQSGETTSRPRAYRSIRPGTLIPVSLSSGRNSTGTGDGYRTISNSHTGGK